MFLRERATQAEYCDRPDLSDTELATSYGHLTRFNRRMLVADPFQRLLVRWIGREKAAALTFLDLGAGDASLATHLEGWARQQQWNWQVTSLDGNERALRLNPHPHQRKVAANVCALPFADNSFDVVMASQMTHHLTDQQTILHFQEAWRVTRDVLFLTDIHRNIGAMTIIWIILTLMGTTPEFRSDGVISVQRGWRLAEWRQLAALAGIPNARISLYYGSRIFLQARKNGVGPTPD
jgi:2-polyprenyl-3-methyl-5-hydroxy-6-metoxy-1,4-benzoquinol methylase